MTVWHVCYSVFRCCWHWTRRLVITGQWHYLIISSSCCRTVRKSQQITAKLVVTRREALLWSQASFTSCKHPHVRISTSLHCLPASKVSRLTAGQKSILYSTAITSNYYFHVRWHPKLDKSNETTKSIHSCQPKLFLCHCVQSSLFDTEIAYVDSREELSIHELVNFLCTLPINWYTQR